MPREAGDVHPPSPMTDDVSLAMGHGKPRTRARGHLSGALAASTSSTAQSPAGRDRAARVERERGVRACGGRASGVGRRAGDALARPLRTFAPAWYPPKWVGLCGAASESPSSRRAARLIGGDWAGRAYHREWPQLGTCGGTAARLRFLRCTCRPMQWRSRLSMKGRSGAGAAGCSGGRRGAAGPDTPLAARHFAALVRRGGRGELPGRGGVAKKNVGVFRSKSYLGECKSPTNVPK